MPRYAPSRPSRRGKLPAPEDGGAAHVHALKDVLDVSSGESSAEGQVPGRRLRRRQAPVSSPGAAFCIV
jgi:hypothetical protein